MSKRQSGFTLIEIMLAVSIVIMILVMIVPSVSGMSAEKRLLVTFEKFNDVVRKAQLNAVEQQRSWVLVWGEGVVSLQPNEPTPEERLDGGAGAREDFEFGEDELYRIERPASLLPADQTPGEWTFWRSGACEPVFVTYEGPAGAWRAQYNPLTGRGEIVEQSLP